MSSETNLQKSIPDDGGQLPKKHVYKSPGKRRALYKKTSRRKKSCGGKKRWPARSGFSQIDYFYPEPPPPPRPALGVLGWSAIVLGGSLKAAQRILEILREARTKEETLPAAQVWPAGDGRFEPMPEVALVAVPAPVVISKGKRGRPKDPQSERRKIYRLFKQVDADLETGRSIDISPKLPANLRRRGIRFILTAVSMQPLFLRWSEAEQLRLLNKVQNAVKNEKADEKRNGLRLAKPE